MQVIVKLQGGLGNQMFQYAIGRYLSLKLNSKLFLDKSIYSSLDVNFNITPRKFELDIFNLNYNNYWISQSHILFQNLYKRFFSLQVFQETSFKYQSSIRSITGNVYLDGYWQNENYFSSIANVIRQDFTFRLDFPDEIMKMKANIESCNAISVHFRRSDYLTNNYANQFHGVCTEEYYIKAIKLIKEKIANPKFFVFSDEIGWVKDNFYTGEEFTYVITNNIDVYDMYLMSICKHHIIANSSFSWWGAWLNPNLDKIVIAPSKWFKEMETDIIPSEWIKI